MDAHQNAQHDLQVAPLPVGTLAPDFALPHTPSTRFALHSLHGERVVIVFYPMDWEPLSRDQLVLFQRFAGEFARLGARMLGISVDGVHCHAAFARELQLHFPLLSDFQPRGAVAHQYGVYRDEHGVSARALFVLDRQSRIRFSHAYPDFFNPGVDDLLTTLETLAAEDAEEAKRGNAVSRPEDTMRAMPIDDRPPGRRPGAVSRPPGSANERHTPADGNGSR